MQNTLWQSGNNYGFYKKKTFLKYVYGMQDPTPFHGKCHKKFHFLRYHQAPQNISKQSLVERSSWRWSVFTLIILAPGMSAVGSNCALSVKVKLISETTSPKRRKNRYHCDKQRIWLAFTKQMILKKFCPMTAFISCRQLFPKTSQELRMLSRSLSVY